MEQLTLEQAATTHTNIYIKKGPPPYDTWEDSINIAFKAGAEWQKKQDNDLLIKLSNVISTAINLTPTGDKRNVICDIHLELLERLQD